MATFTVYHTTRKGNADAIVKNGYWVDRNTTNVYGRGVYFWENYSDAVAYGKAVYGDGKYEVLDQVIELTRSNHVRYDPNRAWGSVDTIAYGLRRRGVHYIVISNNQIRHTTLSSASGRAYCYLVTT